MPTRSTACQLPRHFKYHGNCCSIKQPVRSSRKLYSEEITVVDIRALAINIVSMSTSKDNRNEALEFKKVSLPDVLSSLPDAVILQKFLDLFNDILTHVKKFYTTGPIQCGGASQIMVEQASAGVLLPWPQILDLLSDPHTRPRTLVMCIGRIMLSRSLLLKLGSNNTSGATFLPPELIDTFQSFCIGKSAPTLDGKEPKPLNLALLSRWKQISATLLHETYVHDAFSPFDGRTINIERAIEDLGPLLRTYALPDDGGHGRGTRIADLRDLLRKGARFAFTLFSQPCLWTFDWYHNREIEAAEGQLQPHRLQNSRTKKARDDSMRFKLSLGEIVIWPTLLRVVDEKGCKMGGNGVVCGEKIYLEKKPS